MNSEHSFYLSVGKDLVYKHLNLTKNTIHFIIYRKPELLNPGDNMIEKWNAKESVKEFFDRLFLMDIDIYP